MKPASSASRRVDEDFVRAHSRLTYPQHRLHPFPPFAKPAKDGAPHSLPVHVNLKTGPPVRQRNMPIGQPRKENGSCALRQVPVIVTGDETVRQSSYFCSARC